MSAQQVVVDQLTKRSGDDRTILMHAARSGDAMTLSAVKNACQNVCDPSKVSKPSQQGSATLREAPKFVSGAMF